MEKLKPCPFCKGKARLTFKDYAYGGRNSLGEKQLKYRVQVMCNRCYSRGKPVVTDWLINPQYCYIPWFDAKAMIELNNHMRVKAEMLRPFVEKAVKAWNTRAGEPIMIEPIRVQLTDEQIQDLIETPKKIRAWLCGGAEHGEP